MYMYIHKTKDLTDPGFISDSSPNSDGESVFFRPRVL